MRDVAHDEDGTFVEYTQFDYEAVDEALGSPRDQLADYSQEDIDRALKVLEILLQWVWQKGKNNFDGLGIRAIIICWVCLKEVRPMTETELATGFGKPKQSFGRWIEQFKIFFPRIRLPHMR